MDNNAAQLYISTYKLTQMHDAHSAGSLSKPTEFVNHGLLLWDQTRQKWVVNRKHEIQAQQLCELKLRTLRLCIAKRFCLCHWNMPYSNLLSTDKPFQKPIPLAEMIDFLVDIWDQEGIYD